MLESQAGIPIAWLPIMARLAKNFLNPSGPPASGMVKQVWNCWHGFNTSELNISPAPPGGLPFSNSKLDRTWPSSPGPGEEGQVRSNGAEYNWCRLQLVPARHAQGCWQLFELCENSFVGKAQAELAKGLGKLSCSTVLGPQPAPSSPLHIDGIFLSLCLMAQMGAMSSSATPCRRPTYLPLLRPQERQPPAAAVGGCALESVLK